jgi:hypothetical protein
VACPNAKGQRTGRASSVPPCLRVRRPKSGHGPPPSLRGPFRFSMPRRAISVWWQPRFFHSPQTLSWRHPNFFAWRMVQTQFAAALTTAFQAPPPFITALSPSPPLPPRLRALHLHPPSAPDLGALAPLRLRLRLRDGRTPSVDLAIDIRLLYLRFTTIYDR